jgi:hypothetical protein
VRAARAIAIIAALCFAPALFAQSVDKQLTEAMRLTDSVEAQVGAIEKRADALTAWFGFPDEDVRGRIRELAGALLRGCGLASEAIARAVEASDREESGDAQLRDTLIEARSSRIPLREARAHLLLASIADGPRERDAHRREASDAMAEIRGTSGWIDRETALLDAIATMLDGRSGRAREKFNALRIDLQEEGDGRARLEYTPPVTLGLLVTTLETNGWSRARTAARTLLDKSPFVVAGERDPALALVAADLRARIDAARAREDVVADSRERKLDEMFEHYGDFAHLLIENGTPPREAWALACDESRDAVMDWMDEGRLPPIARGGLARDLLARDETSARGAELGRSALRDADAGGLRDVLAWTMVPVLIRTGEEEDARFACELATSIARRHPADDDAVRLAGGIAVRLLDSQSAPVLETALAALRFVHERGGVERIATYRLALARALSRRGGEANLREAIRVLETEDVSGGLGVAAAIESARASGALFRETGFDDDARLWLARARRAASLAEGGDRAIAESQVVDALLALDRPKDAQSRARDAWESARVADDPGARLRLAHSAVRASGRAGDLALASEVLDGIFEDADRAAPVFRLAYESASSRVETVGTRFIADVRDAPVRDTADVLERVSGWSRVAGDAALASASDERLASALILTGEPAQALEMIESLRDRAGVTAERLRLSAEARIALGDDAGAFADLRRLAQAKSDRVSESAEYWYAWARMLEILQRQNEQGARTRTIRREITRLRATDGYGLCNECAERIERVARSVGME